MEGFIEVVESFAKPTAEYPDGSYMRKVAGVVEIATGVFSIDHPDKPSPYWHGKAPIVMFWPSGAPWQS